MISYFRGWQRVLMVGVTTCVLAACGGGGSSVAVPEFDANYGLGAIGAQFAYARGADGNGVIVAVIDSGIDRGHFDLDGNISPASIDIINPGDPITDDNGHGTQVAGVIAAERNGIGMHGVAYNATILAIDADSGGGFTDPDIASAIDYAVANSADIINMSLGGPAVDAMVLRQAQINATAVGVILVSATGNARTPVPGTGVQPEYPAANAGDVAMNGLALAVGSVDRFGNLSSFSNFCGDSRDFCLVAPGESILTTDLGNTTASVSGTSFSTPHVSGAAALLIQLFPTLTPEDVVQILLTSATDLGTAGVDALFGHGMLNVDAATAPIGMLAVPLEGTAAGGAAAVGDTRLALGAAFGNVLSGAGLLGNVVALDDFDRPYPVDLLTAVASADRSFQLENRLVASDTQVISVPAPGVTLRMAMSDDPNDPLRWGPGQRRSASEVDAVSLAGEFATDTGWHLGLDISANAQLQSGPVVLAADTLFLAADEMTSPHYALLGSGDGVRLDQSLSGATTLSLGWFASESIEVGDDDFAWGGGNMIQATLDHAFAAGGGLRMEVARLEESDTFLGSKSGGAFGAGVGATSNFLTMSGGVPIASTVDLVGSITSATTEVAGAGLLDDWGTVRSTAFSGGVVARDVFRSGDRFGFLAGQPLRVHQADATLTVPVGITAADVVLSESQRVDLSPSGREMNVQLAYDRNLWEGASVSSWLLMRTEPGHDANAANDYGVGLVFRMAY